MTLPRFCFAFLLLITVLLSCGSEEPVPQAEADPKQDQTDSFEVVRENAPLAAGAELRAWVDGLFLRAEPEQGATVLTQVAAATPLTYTGESSSGSEILVLRGIVFEEPWLKVRTADDQEGWVYGGGVRRAEESRGSGYRSAAQFDFPHFGNFNLSGWKQEPTTETSGGDATRTRTVYTRSDQNLAVQLTEVGEYGYEINYILTDAAGNDLKTRTLIFEVDPHYRLIETVTDYTVSPPIRYRRTQQMPTHYSQLNTIPQLATGDWTSTTLAE